MFVVLSGHSDDLLHVTIDGSVEEFGVFNRHKIQAVVRLEHPKGIAKVYAIYDGCWAFSFGLGDQYEDMSFIYQATHVPGHPYSMNLNAHVMRDTEITVWDANGIECLARYLRGTGWKFYE